MTERVTIDRGVTFNNIRTSRKASLKDSVIIEIKQDGRTQSTMRSILLDHRVKPIRVSKYCMGITLTDPAVKSNRFKLKVRKIEKQIKQKLI